MLIRRPPDIPSSEITDERLYVRRREFLETVGLAAAGLAVGAVTLDAQPSPRPPKLDHVVKGPFGTTEAQTSYEDVTSYNNFYEFGYDKSSPSRVAGSLRTLVESTAFKRTVGTVYGDSLRRVPHGYPPEHPAAEYLKLKQFIFGKHYPAAFAVSPGFYATVVRQFERMAPVIAFLNDPLLAALARRDPLALETPVRRGRSI